MLNKVLEGVQPSGGSGGGQRGQMPWAQGVGGGAACCLLPPSQHPCLQAKWSRQPLLAQFSFKEGEEARGHSAVCLPPPFKDEQTWFTSSSIWLLGSGWVKGQGMRVNQKYKATFPGDGEIQF